jgi:methionyl-tRNA formyltransferase
MRFRIIYMGTPEFACPSLRMLASAESVEIPLVVTQPDRMAGRGRRLQAPPVKRVADELGLAVYQPPSLRSAEQRKPILDLEPDLIVVAAFGIILGKSILELPRVGCVNLHASLLPRYRGASPVSAAILNGDRETGVTLMKMEKGLDTGPMFDRSIVELSGHETTESLTTRLAASAADLLSSNLGALLSGNLSASGQPSGASLTRPLTKADGWIDWSQPAQAIERHVRAMWPWPRAWTTLPDESAFQIHRATLNNSPQSAMPGLLLTDGDGLRVCCGDGWLRLEAGQLPGGKPLTGVQLSSRRELSGKIILGTGDRPGNPGPLITILADE